MNPVWRPVYQRVTRRIDISLIVYNHGVILSMSWEVEYTDEFEEWWTRLDAEEQVSVEAVVEVLAEMGPPLPFPYSSDVKRSIHGNMRELRVSSARQLLALALQQREEIQVRARRPLILSSTAFPHPPE